MILYTGNERESGINIMGIFFCVCDLECSKMEWVAFGKYELSFSRFNGFLEEIYLQRIKVGEDKLQLMNPTVIRS